MANDMTVMERTVQKNGWKVDRTGGDHRKWVAPNGATVIVSNTPSDTFRAAANTAREMKKYGYGPDGKPLPDTDPEAVRLDLEEKAIQAKAENELREERRLAERLNQSLADTDTTTSAVPTGVQEAMRTEKRTSDVGTADELLAHPMLQYTVEDPPPYVDESKEGSLAKARLTWNQMRKDGVRPAAKTINNKENSNMTEFNIDALLSGAVESAPKSAAQEVWDGVFEKIAPDKWFLMPGEYTPAQVRAVRSAGRAEAGRTVRVEASITTDNSRVWIKRAG